MEAFLGDGKVWNKKLYVATKSTLEGTKTQPYAVPLTGYRMVNNKMYKYTKGTPVLFTGIYNGTETNLKQYKGCYLKKGVKQKLPDGWKTVGKKRYYIKNGKYLTGWHYIKYNGATYRYFFDKTGAQVQDLFSYNRAYMKRKMLVQIATPTPPTSSSTTPRPRSMTSPPRALSLPPPRKPLTSRSAATSWTIAAVGGPSSTPPASPMAIISTPSASRVLPLRCSTPPATMLSGTTR